ncbi:MBL fold metallo-hydrolase [Peribacillus alkalitolerans]|uniref:MBL fold metallo-hydrolase n=1 Tax=Peribacillus alkalitolerans TaxID=1550385 RepID=UPI0013D092F2|nr:MBL fold metallo-hydrolase [Peribacillus alkalitolerans]
MNQFGIYQVSIPLPYWNDSVHCYLGQNEGKWTIIDTSMNNEKTRQCWEAAFSRFKINPKREVERIFITHHHPDHFEYASELQRQTGADIFINQKEQSNLIFLEKESFSSYYLTAGMPQELVMQLHPVNHSTKKFPNNIHTFDPNVQYPIGELHFEAIQMPGHSDGHICFYNREEQILISGDHLTRETIPYISYHGYGDVNPLSTYLETLMNMLSMKISLVLPGHGPNFTDAKERIIELIHHYETRISHVLALVTGEMSAFEISNTLFPNNTTVLDQWIALGETNAYLNYLTAKGKIGVLKEHHVNKYFRL